jgi:hypothetical protein
MAHSNTRRLSWKTRLIGATVLALAGIGQSMAVPLTVGTQVVVGDAPGTNVFTPSPVNGDANGLYVGSVTFLLNYAERKSASAGLFVLNQAPVGTTAWDEFQAFCLQPNVYLTPFSNPYTVRTLSEAGYPTTPNNYISELWARYRSHVQTDTTAAAFQVSLWELAYGATDRDLGDGVFQLEGNSAVRTQAQTWLTSLTGQGPQASGLVVLQNSRYAGVADTQDLLTQTTAVPEPGTLALLALGLIGLAWSRQSKRGVPLTHRG